MSEPEALPAGTTVYFCPLCGWSHPQLPPTERELMEAIEETPVVYLRRKLGSIEAEVEAHLNTHGLLDWLTEVSHLRSELDASQEAFRRLDAERQNAERDAVLVAAALTRKLGGSALVTDLDLVQEDATLVRVPEMHGFTLTLVERQPSASR
jgi:hypothetical protein